jgi:hypothetical protein
MGMVTPPEKLDKYIVPLPMMFSVGYFITYYSLDSVPTGANAMGAVSVRSTSDGMVLDGYQSMPAGVATQEVKVIDVLAPAEFATAATTVTVTKGGTNNLHAAAEYSVDNSALNALGPTPSSRPAGTGSYKSSFSGSGPIVIPHVYNGRNRTFFFASYDRSKTSLFYGYDPVLNVPTAGMRSGDFSQYKDSSGNLIPIIDPRTGQQFADNMIPVDRISPVAAKFMTNYLPAPNFGSDPNTPYRNWHHVPAISYGSLTTNIIHFRIDQKLSEKGTLNLAFNRYIQHERLYGHRFVHGKSSQ